MGWLANIFGNHGGPEAIFDPVDDAKFATILAADEKPVMLFLWGDACPYCRKMVPNVKNVLARHHETVIGVHANASEVPGIAQALNLRGVPATVFFRHGRLVELVTGFQPEAVLDRVIETRFGAEPSPNVPARQD
jgi:thioredoxin-like negative regulator of GroEL